MGRRGRKAADEAALLSRSRRDSVCGNGVLRATLLLHVVPIRALENLVAPKRRIA